jgi:hypothetical protein
MERDICIKRLCQIIEDNEGCSFQIDNDIWYITNKEGRTIASSEKYQWKTKWYGHSSNYGAGLSEVLLELLWGKGIQIEASGV